VGKFYFFGDPIGGFQATSIFVALKFSVGCKTPCTFDEVFVSGWRGLQFFVALINMVWEN